MRILASPAFENRSNNPYNALLYSEMDAEVVEFTTKLSLAQHFDIFHVHWPESPLSRRSPIGALQGMIELFRVMDMLRARGCRVVWTIHNLGPHERRHLLLKHWFYNRLLRRLDGYLVLSNMGLTIARERFPKLRQIPSRITVHGHYRSVYPQTVSVENPRSLLGLPAHAKVILFFGQVREYKNVPGLIRAFRQMEDSGAHLLIVGRPAHNFPERELRNEANNDPRIRLVLRHVQHEEVPAYFAAADLVVLPYRDVLNSGSTLLALSFNRPVLVPNLGTMPELSQAVGENWVRTFDGPLKSSDLMNAARWATERDPNSSVELANFDWKTIADQTLEFFDQLVSNRDSYSTRAIVSRQ